ncbi:MAG: AsmA-like C-terminal region-containing protein [Bacteroidota bacterium]
MKKFLLILAIIFGVLIVSIIVLPIVFKDDIQKALDDALAENLEAQVYYDPSQFDLSLLKNFPNLTVSLGDFGIVGVEDFSSDTLAAISSFQLTIDIMSVISGDQISVREVLLDQPRISVVVLENGKANYDIAKATADTAQVEEPAEASDLSIAIDRWAIKEGSLSYDDQSLKFYTTLDGLDHEGSGDFTLDVFDLATTTKVQEVSLGYDGVEYLTNKTLIAEVVLNMDLSKMLFVFEENSIALNDFVMAAEGSISMPADDIDIDITFGGKDIDPKSILSLIPGVYQEYLADISASGDVSFDGVVQGTYNEASMPKIMANLSVKEGSVKYSAFDIPMEKINIESNFSYPSADLRETSFDLSKFSMLVDGEELQAYLKFKNLEDYTWDFGADGSLDLEKITKIVPLEDMDLRGKLNIALKSAGSMSILEREQYDQLPTSGSLSVNDFYFESIDLPQGFGISEANLSFDPSMISLDQFQATSGNSDFSLQGAVRDYLDYALNDGTLVGSLSLNSTLLDVNEFIPEVSKEEEEQTDTTALEVVKIPENIDFTFASAIDKITYTDLELRNFQGKVLVKDGAVVLDRNSFEMLDGTFELSGSYKTKDLDLPKYDLGFGIKDLSIASAFESFSTIEKYVPIAKQITGKFSTDFKVNGLLGNDMMPLLDKVNLAGLVNVAQAALEKGEFVNKLNSIASFKGGTKSNASSDAISIKDVLIKAAIRDGRLFVEPFNLNVKGQKATLGGSNTLDGKLDYSMLIKEIPTGAVGTALNSAISSFTGGKSLVSDKIDVDLGIGGTYNDIQVKLLSTSASGNASEAAAAFKQQITTKVDEQKAKVDAEIEKRKEAQKQKIIAEAKEKAAQIRKAGASTAESVRKEGYAAADKLIADAGSNPLKKKVAQEAAKKLRAEADKKADGILAESNKKADQLVAEAQENADKI